MERFPINAALMTANKAALQAPLITPAQALNSTVFPEYLMKNAITFIAQPQLYIRERAKR